MSVIDNGVIEVDPVVVAGWIQSGEALVVDVREDEEWDEERIEGTTLSPMSDFEFATFPKPDAGQRLVVVCAVGRRSGAIARKVQQLGQGLVYNMTGGLTGWKEADLPTVR